MLWYALYSLISICYCSIQSIIYIYDVLQNFHRYFIDSLYFPGILYTVWIWVLTIHKYVFGMRCSYGLLYKILLLCDVSFSCMETIFRDVNVDGWWKNQQSSCLLVFPPTINILPIYVSEDGFHVGNWKGRTIIIFCTIMHRNISYQTIELSEL